jgi:hypothetical protein
MGILGHKSYYARRRKQIITIHLPGRRQWLFTSTSPNVEGDKIPPSQPPYVPLKFLAIDYNPSSYNQQEEFICITNPMPMEIDISGWRIDGAVQFTFNRVL